METDIIVVNDDFNRIEDYARQLINHTLVPLESAIEIIAVKVDHDMTIPSASIDFHCTILLKIRGGATIRAEARDCDDILAVYRALTKIVDQFPMLNLGDDCDMPRRVEDY